MTFPNRHGPWQILSRREVYRDAWIELVRHEVTRPDGAPGSHCIVRLKPGVSVLPLDARGIVHLTEEFHYGVGRATIEVVSGGIEPGEDPLVTARRELQEELGITAGEWIDLGVCDPFTSVVVSPTRLFLARQLAFGPTTLEGTELIRCHAVPLAEAVQMVLDSRITHGPSCVLILKANHLLQY
ncbi:MAG TPA: NUDIX hydrolase [Pirellulales bacterium]|jgi:ADP-ribose pyrophosphatase|nr:NUDIX hydrolase [Pirellulales bacterium]